MSFKSSNIIPLSSFGYVPFSLFDKEGSVRFAEVIIALVPSLIKNLACAFDDALRCAPDFTS